MTVLQRKSWQQKEKFKKKEDKIQWKRDLKQVTEDSF